MRRARLRLPLNRGLARFTRRGEGYESADMSHSGAGFVPEDILAP